MKSHDLHIATRHHCLLLLWPLDYWAYANNVHVCRLMRRLQISLGCMWLAIAVVATVAIPVLPALAGWLFVSLLPLLGTMAVIHFLKLYER